MVLYDALEAFSHALSEHRGIYVHIPFCHAKCAYCDFYSVVRNDGVRAAYIQQLLKELQQPHFPLQRAPIHSLYIGGGTPSLLNPDSIAQLIDAIAEEYSLHAQAEITLECNPEDITPAFLQRVAQAGINRLSMGIQSIDAPTLAFLGRNHTPHVAQYAMECIANSTISNYSFDLIYGIPNSPITALEETLKQLLQYHPPHLSAYHLSIERGTQLYQQCRKKYFAPLSDTESEHQYFLVHQMLTEAGYHHYEISNYAQPEQYARHNSAYWLGGHYLGLGASAHSYDGKCRYANPSHIKAYAESLHDNSREGVYRETITPSMALDEWLLTRLRTLWGLNLTQGRVRFGETTILKLLQYAQPWIKAGKMQQHQQTLYIKPEGFLCADAIILSLASALSRDS